MGAVAEDICNGTSALAPRLRQPPTNAATIQHADVFARRERRPAAVSLSEPKGINVSFQIGGQPVRLTYTGSGADLPAWALPVLQSLSERWGIEPGWDSYDAKPTDLQHAVQLLNYLSALLRDGSTPPVITPLSDGGVQAEWHRSSQDLEIVVPVGEPPRFYYYNASTEKEEEGELVQQHFEQVRALIDKF